MTEKECQTVQQYIAMLFDDLQPAPIPNSSLCSELLTQIISYGKKIIDLSQQSTFKYRNQHFLPRNEVEFEIGNLFKVVIGEQPQGNFEKMTKTIYDKLQWERKSIWAKHSLPESRLIQVSQFKSQDPNKPILEEEQNSLKPSRARSKARGSRVSTTVKQVLHIKNCFEEEQASLRDFYQKITKMLETHKVPMSSLEPESLKYSRCSNENTSDKVADLVRGLTLNNSKNINNLSNLVDLLNDNLSKRLKNQGIANGKLDAYCQEIKKMEEVHSYTLSKLLQNLSTVKNLVRQDPSYCLQHINTVEEIIQKMYDLFPTSETLQHISSSSRGVKQTRAFGVQTNSVKTTEKKTTPETYRLQIKVNEYLDKFEKNMKFKKTIETKQIEKYFDTLRELVATSKTLPSQESSFQEELRKLMDLNDKKQKQTTDTHNKRVKKLEKKIQEFQTLLDTQKVESQKLEEKWQGEKKKLMKKIETEQNQYKKLASQKGHLQINLSEMINEIQSMRDAVRRQGNQQNFKRIQLQKEREELAERTEAVSQKLNENIEEMRLEKQKINEERSIYKQKIQLIQKQLQQQRQLSTGLRLELDTVISDHRTLKNKLKQMSSIYEQKIKEVQEMIENIHELQTTKKEQEETIEQMSKDLTTLNNKYIEQSKTVQNYVRSIEDINKENNFLRVEVEKWKEEGKLTDSDLKALKQEVDKVNAAYVESEGIIESTRQELTIVNQERQKFFREKTRLTRALQDVQSQLHSFKTRHQALQLSERDMKDQYYEKCQEASRTFKQNEELKRDLLRLKKEITEQNLDRAKLDKQLRQLRQEVQSKRETQSADRGKYRLEIENMRVQLRKKGQQLQKQRQAYEQRLGVMTQRMQDLQQVLGQKQLLSKLMQHQSQ